MILKKNPVKEEKKNLKGDNKMSKFDYRKWVTENKYGILNEQPAEPNPISPWCDLITDEFIESYWEWAPWISAGNQGSGGQTSYGLWCAGIIGEGPGGDGLLGDVSEVIGLTTPDGITISSGINDQACVCFNNNGQPLSDVVDADAQGMPEFVSSAWTGGGGGDPNNPTQGDYDWGGQACETFALAPQEMQDLVCNLCEDPTYINSHCECCGSDIEDSNIDDLDPGVYTPDNPFDLLSTPQGMPGGGGTGAAAQRKKKQNKKPSNRKITKPMNNLRESKRILEKILHERKKKKLNEEITTAIAGIVSMIGAAGGLASVQMKMEDPDTRAKYPKLAALLELLGELGTAASQAKLKEQDDEEPISDDVFADLEGEINDMFDLEGTCPSDPAMNKKMMGDRQPDNLKNQD